MYSDVAVAVVIMVGILIGVRMVIQAVKWVHENDDSY